MLIHLTKERYSDSGTEQFRGKHELFLGFFIPQIYSRSTHDYKLILTGKDISALSSYKDWWTHTWTDTARISCTNKCQFILNFHSNHITTIRASFVLNYIYGCICRPSLESTNSTVFYKSNYVIYQQCLHPPVVLSWSGARPGQYAAGHQGDSGTDLPAR